MFVTPNVFGQFGVVNKWIAVALYAKDGFIALDFLLAHGIQPGPFQQHIDGPGSERFVLVGPVVELVASRPAGQLVFITGRHIEVGACQITLVLIVRLKHRPAVARISACTQFALGIEVAVGQSLAIGAHAIWKIAPLAVYLDIGGIDMKHIGIHGCDSATKPTPGETVLTVIALADIVGRRPVITGFITTIAVDVDYIALIIGVGFPEGV